MQDEITPGLKNAVERGESLENAVQSFINAGYNPVEVRSAASSLTQGVTSISSAVQFNFPQPLKEQEQPPQENLQQSYSPLKQSRRNPSSKILLIVVLITLLLFVAGMITLAYFFGEQILNFITG